MASFSWQESFLNEIENSALGTVLQLMKPGEHIGKSHISKLIGKKGISFGEGVVLEHLRIKKLKENQREHMSMPEYLQKYKYIFIGIESLDLKIGQLLEFFEDFNDKVIIVWDYFDNLQLPDTVRKFNYID